ncbi:LAGLIDADG family homing endonuclease [Natronococcus occultus]|uniref:DNA helicase n=1 Tax=Natronococcus occultus SP4 TaxID=694430 RepID=L0JUS0_9EURY|nr:LAGLIDADG family homing endonuclease [Natronococcus occultus]AGB36040.1 putative ATPase involved in replication control, Cdc46/Mcm family [Natronococcus occultus SP4]
MAQAGNSELVDSFEQFFRNYYDNEIKQLAQQYPNEQRSLHVDWQDLYRYDPNLADDFLAQPEQLQRYAEEALRLYDLPIDVSLGQAHVRVHNLPETESPEIRDIRARDMNSLVQVRGIVRKATDVRPKIEEAAFECQLCGTLTRVPQSSGDFQEPHECQGCERQGPFRVNFDQSEFVDSQKLRIQESPEGLRGGETPQSLDVHVEDDITGEVTPGDHVSATGVLRLEQQGDGQDKSPVFDFYMEGMAVDIDEEQFEDMDITEEDKEEIVRLSSSDDIYEQMVGSIAPSIYGYEQEKLAMILQLFSGVTKQLPDGSRIRGDLHMLLIGDPGTGKCVRGDTKVTLADGRNVPIRDLVEANIEDPKPIDDGWYDEIDLEVPSLQDDGSIAPQRATKVWKREAPDQMYQIRTSSGRELEVTPSHPLFVGVADGYRAIRADELSVGDSIAVTTGSANTVDQPTVNEVPVLADGGTVASTSAVADQINSIETVDPDYDWVYDLEIEGTHNYVSNGIISHNSQMLGYIQNIAPRSVYTSGKGSSSAGLCVTGETLIHTEDGFRQAKDVATTRLPDPVDTETAVEDEIGLYTFDRDSGALETRSTSHVWRMPPKECRRIETARGKELEASQSTPVLTCGEDGLEWTQISNVEAGDYVAVPKYDEVDRSTPPIEDYLEFTNEKLKLADESIVQIRRQLCETYGTLRDAAAELDLSEDFVYDTIRNRHIPIAKLERVLEGIDLELDQLSVERAMLRHGDGVRIPDEFDEDLCYLLGLVFGDGDIRLSRRDGNRGLVRISNSDETILERAVEIVDDTFDKRPEIEYQDDRVPCIRVHSATIAQLFSNAGMETPKEDLKLDPALTTAEHADAFLRGLMDADGSVSSRTDGGSSIHFSTISQEFAEQVQLMLETYGVRSRVRERDRRGVSVLENGYEIESNHVQYHLECYGRNIERYADAIGFGYPTKRAALEEIVGDATRREEKIPVGTTLATVDAAGGEYYMNLNRGDNPGRGRARRMLEEVDLGDAEPIVEEAVEADLCWDEVVAAVDTGEKEVFDLTVPETHNFLANGVVTHNTAAAVRDDFGDGQQWTLEAGALVLADQGIAAVDELDKMRCVTGESLVELSNGSSIAIEEIAQQAAKAGEIEPLENGRTMRNVDVSVRTMTDSGAIVERPVTAVHQYETPSELIEVITEDGEKLRSTPDHPFFIRQDGSTIERSATNLEVGDRTLVPCNESSIVTDGGAVMTDQSARSSLHDVEPSEIVKIHRIDGDEWDYVYDLTVEGTHNFIANGMVVHNSEDRSAMHEALEQQKISVSKAGINATLKSRCSLLGAANPKYGRFDQYEPIGEQIDLEPALISRFDLIFTVTDQPDEEKDKNLAEHILTTNYAGELTTQREEMTSLEVSEEEIEEMTEQVDPVIDAELLRKYIAYAKQNCHPRMTEDARETIRDFYVDLRAKGTDEDAPVPVTARKLEALVRLSEASARVRLSDTVEQRDAERVVEIVRSCLQDIGVDPETGEFDADIVEAGTSKSQRDRIKNIKGLISDIEEEYDEGAPVDIVLERADEIGMDESKAEHEIDKLKQKGEVYEPSTDTLRTT